MMKIIGCDIGKDLTVAVSVSELIYETTEPADYFLDADFVECSPDLNGLNKLLALDGDLYIMEPTGRYSRVWADNLVAAGKDVRFVAHDKLSAYRGNCGWTDKDDYHDAVALAWYGWDRRRRPNAFNRIRDPIVKKMMGIFLRHRRLADEYTVFSNQGRNLLSHECPEIQNRKAKSRKVGYPPPLWAFIAGDERLTAHSKTLYKRVVKKSIGTVGQQFNGAFSDELVKIARRCCDISVERDELESELKDFLRLEQFRWYQSVFDVYGFGTFQRVLILHQIYPFEQMLSDSLGEIKVKMKRRSRSNAGKLPKRRVSWGRFHSALGKAPSQRSSGKKQGMTVEGSSLCRSYLFLWANVHIFRRSPQFRKHCYPFKEITHRYESSIREAGDLELAIASALNSNENLIHDMKKVLNGLPGGHTVIEHLEKTPDRLKHKLSLEQVKKESKKVLGNWAKSRATDLLVKMLFKDLLQACREHHR